MGELNGSTISIYLNVDSKIYILYRKILSHFNTNYDYTADDIVAKYDGKMNKFYKRLLSIAYSDLSIKFKRLP